MLQILCLSCRSLYRIDFHDKIPPITYLYSYKHKHTLISSWVVPRVTCRVHSCRAAAWHVFLFHGTLYFTGRGWGIVGELNSRGNLENVVERLGFSVYSDKSKRHKLRPRERFFFFSCVTKVFLKLSHSCCRHLEPISTLSDFIFCNS